MIGVNGLSARFIFLGAAALCALLLTNQSALAATAPAAIDGAQLNLAWIAPFIGILASLAIFPAIAPEFWHRRYGLVSLFWALAFLLPFAARFGTQTVAQELFHALALEYIPFIVLIGALFTIAGGIHVGGPLHGSPPLNTALLLIGMALASFVGTTGASMIMIRPLIRANSDRPHNAHAVIFFIFLVSNIGGALTPLGDPPLFLGYLNGVHFSWPLRALWAPTLLTAGLLLAAFLALDVYLYRKEGRIKARTIAKTRISVRGLVNIPLILLLAAVVVASGSQGAASLGSFSALGTEILWAHLLRDLALIALAVASLVLTPATYRKSNEFNWEPVLEVAKLFAAIFVTIIPAIAILRAGSHGAFAPLLSLLDAPDAPNNAAYFWLTGALSGLLDNAPTYLVFFTAAGGDASRLMGPMADTLAAISAGAVFMGANTYVGNAPNFMVKAIAEHRGIKMPGFFGYMAWATVFLLPCFAVITVLFFV